MSEDYQAFLLRLQHVSSASRWRASLENAHTGEVFHFASERELIRFLLLTCSSGASTVPIDDSAAPEE